MITVASSFIRDLTSPSIYSNEKMREDEDKVSTVAKVAFVFSLLSPPLAVFISMIEAIILIVQHASSNRSKYENDEIVDEDDHASNIGNIRSDNEKKGFSFFASYEKDYEYSYRADANDETVEEDANTSLQEAKFDNAREQMVGDNEIVLTPDFEKQVNAGKQGYKLYNQEGQELNDLKGIVETLRGDSQDTSFNEKSLSNPFIVIQVLLTENLLEPYRTYDEVGVMLDEDLVAAEREGTHKITLGSPFISIKDGKNVYQISSERKVDFSIQGNVNIKSYLVKETYLIKEPSQEGGVCEITVKREVI